MSTEIDAATIAATAGRDAVAAFKARSNTINACEGAKLHPKLAAALVDNDAITAEAAVALLKVAGDETAAAVAAKPAPEPVAKTDAEKQAELDAQKKAAGALGIGTPASTEGDRSSIDGGWAKAAKAANARFGAAGVN